MSNKIYNESLGIYIPANADVYQKAKSLTTDDYRQNVKNWLQTVKPFHPDSKFHEYSDISISKMFCEASSSFLAYFLNPDDGLGNWRVYNDGIWRLDIKGKQVERGIKVFAEEVLKYVKNDKDLSNCLRIAKDLQTKPRRKRLLDDAETECYLSTSLLDSNRYLFVCKNGVFDGRNLEFREHCPKDYCTKSSKVIFNPNAKSITFEKFINETFSDDEELIDFVQRLNGSMLIGTRLPQEFYIYFGETRSGKGTLNTSVDNVLDCYSEVAVADLFISNKKAPSGHNESLASFVDKRLVYMDEVDIGQSINCKLLKAMTGGTKIRVSRKHEHEFTFTPQWHLVLMTNHRIAVDDPTIFDSYRIVVIPFNNHHTFEEIDIELSDKLTSPEASSAILNWMIKGYKKFHDDGYKLLRPKCIDEAIEEYRGNRNIALQYVTEMLEENKSKNEKANDVFEGFLAWCKVNSTLPKGKNAFFQDLRDLNIDVSRGAGNQLMIKGYSLRELNTENTSAESDYQEEEYYEEIENFEDIYYE